MSVWRVDFEAAAVRDLEELSPKVREQILEKIEWLEEHFSEVNPIGLGGPWRGFFKLRVGDYRILYDVQWSSFRLVVVLIDHRSRVYRRGHRS